MANYGVFYFGLAPILSYMNLPSGSARPSKTSPIPSLRQVVFGILALVIGITVPLIQPGWFDHSYQFLSEVNDSPLLGKDSTHAALMDHLLQLSASSLLLITCLEAAPRRSTLFSTMGSGTFSCFILHWWLRPIWLSALTRLMAHVAPLLQSCDGDESTVMSGVCLALLFMFCLLLVQYSLSGIWVSFGESVSVREDDRFELRFPLRYHNVKKYISLKFYYIWALLKGRGSPIIFSCVKLAGHVLLWSLFAYTLLNNESPNMPGNGNLYLGGKCAAVVVHSSLTQVGVSSSLPVYMPTQPMKPLIEGGGVCLLMNGGGVSYKSTVCEGLHKLQGPALASCLNR